jgi:hypothetical protein
LKPKIEKKSVNSSNSSLLNENNNNNNNKAGNNNKNIIENNKNKIKVIKLSKKTGLPILDQEEEEKNNDNNNNNNNKNNKSNKNFDDFEEDEDDSDGNEAGEDLTWISTRNKNETPEEKRNRKKMLKERKNVLIFIFLKSTFTMYRKLGNRIKY